MTVDLHLPDLAVICIFKWLKNKKLYKKNWKHDFNIMCLEQTGLHALWKSCKIFYFTDIVIIFTAEIELAYLYWPGSDRDIRPERLGQIGESLLYIDGLLFKNQNNTVPIKKD